MTRKELTGLLSEKLSITKDSAENVLKATVETITEGLTSDGAVIIPGFGSFCVRTRPARQYRNIRTGEFITIDAKKTVAFKPAKAMKESIQ